MSDAPALTARDLVVAYGERRVLDGLDLDVPAGAVLGVVGRSGSGTTTLAHALGGDVPAPGRLSGSVTLRPGADDTVDLRETDAPGRHVGIVTGSAAEQFGPAETVRDAVSAAAPRGVFDAALDRARRALAALGQDTDRVLDARPAHLDAGAASAAAVAAAVAPGPAVLVLDSPPVEFDALVRDLDLDALVLVGGDVPAIAAVADRLAVLYDGRIVESGATEALLDGADHPAARRLLDAGV